MDMSHAVRHRWAKVRDSLDRDTRSFARTLGAQRKGSSELFVIGTPVFEPWHFVAHLSEEATRMGRPDLRPHLLRWSVPLNAPRHLSRSVDEMLHVPSGHTVLVIDPADDGDPELLNRVEDAKRRGSRIFSMHRDDADLMELSHESLSVAAARPHHDFDITQHVVTDLTPQAPLF
jgi:hypothetical protein